MKIAFFGDSLTAGRPGASYFEVLRGLLPEHELTNYGRGGDSVIGACEAISDLRPGESFDMAFLWIGTNDVFVKVSPTFPFVRMLLRQPWTRSYAEFFRTYQSALNDLCLKARSVYTLSPWLVGENTDNQWNLALDDLSAGIEALSKTVDNVRFIDLRAHFRSRLAAQPVSDYVAKGAMGIAWDMLTLNDIEQVNRRARERGLLYTLDGTHLNGSGAEIVAGVFADTVNGAMI